MIMRWTLQILTLALGAACSTLASAAPDKTDARIAQILRDEDLDHLKPETPFSGFSYFGFAGGAVLKAYPQALGPGIAARVFSDLTFCCSILTTLDKRRDDYRVISVTVSNAPDSKKQPKPSRCETNLPLVLGDRLVALWRGVLQRTRYGKTSQGGADGATYVFGSSFMTGQIWTPPPETVPGKLVAIVSELETVCQKKSGTAKLDAMSHALKAELVHYQ